MVFFEVMWYHLGRWDKGFAPMFFYYIHSTDPQWEILSTLKTGVANFPKWVKEKLVQEVAEDPRNASKELSHLNKGQLSWLHYLIDTR